MQNINIVKQTVNDYIGYYNMYRQKKLDELNKAGKLLSRLSQHVAPPAWPAKENVIIQTHIFKAVRLISEATEHKNDQGRIDMELLIELGAELKLERTQLSYIIYGSPGQQLEKIEWIIEWGLSPHLVKDDPVDESKWMDIAVRLFAAKSDEIFKPFAVSWHTFINTPASRFVFVKNLQVLYAKKVQPLLQKKEHKLPETKIQNMFHGSIQAREKLYPWNNVEYQKIEVPTSFDLRDDLIAKNCASLIPRSQQQCGSCWAFSIAAQIGTRMCMASQGKIDMRPAPAELVTSVYPWSAFYPYIEISATNEQNLIALITMADEGILPEGCAGYQCVAPSAHEIASDVMKSVINREKGIGRKSVTFEEAAAKAKERIEEKTSNPSSQSSKLSNIVSKLTENRKSSLRLQTPEKRKEMVSSFANIFLSKLKSGRANGLESAPKENNMVMLKPMNPSEREKCSKAIPIQIQMSSEQPIKIMGKGKIRSKDLVKFRQHIQKEIKKDGPISVMIDMGRLKAKNVGFWTSRTSQPTKYIDSGASSPSKDINHVILVIGWRPDKNSKDGSVEWLVQNSWNPAEYDNYFYVSERTLPFDYIHQWLSVTPKLPDCCSQSEDEFRRMCEEDDDSCEHLPGNNEKATHNDLVGEVGAKNDKSQDSIPKE